MLELLQMWALIEVLGLACLPLTSAVFHNLPDRGWAFSKAIGMLVLSFAVWFPLMWLRFIPFNQGVILGVFLLLIVGNLIGGIRMRHQLFKGIRLNLSYIIGTEVVFLGMVFLMGWLRSFGPGINTNEMFMDEGFIASIIRSPHLPPNDMWFAGSSINYYYYAHYVIAMLAKGIGQSPSIAFNTGICIYFGLTAVNLFGVTCNIVAWARHMRTYKESASYAEVARPDTVHPPLGWAMPYGLLTIVMGLILGNLAATQQWWNLHGGPLPFNFWYTPSRVIVNTINEFPAFSFLLSCFHAHVLALAFTILAVSIAFNILLEPEGLGLNAFGRGWFLPINLIVSALVLGALFTMNGWDYPTYLGIALVCVIIQQWLAYHARFEPALLLDIFVAGVSLAALSFILYLPFYLNFISPSQGIGLVKAVDRSPLRDVILVYGIFAFVFLSLLVASAVKWPLFPLTMLRGSEDEDEEGSGFWRYAGIMISVVLVVGVVATLYLLPNSMTFAVAMTITIVGLIVMFYHAGDRAHAFTLLLGSVAFALVAACEIVFLRDVFADSLPRMNTVFKFYFQAWALLSIASGTGLYFILQSLYPEGKSSRLRKIVQWSGTGLWSVGLLVLLAAGFVYPLLAPAMRYGTNPFTLKPGTAHSTSLDGLEYMRVSFATSGDYYAIRWLNTHVQGDPVIVESGGDSYTTASRISAFTGLPTILGWTGHEWQWRYNWLNQGDNLAAFQRRSVDIDLIYSSPDDNDVITTMKKYHAEYLYVGQLEYQKYASSDLHRFGRFMQKVYDANGVTIYKLT